MNSTIIIYAIYLTISISLTMWVARILFKNGRVFLVDSFDGNEAMADSVNMLLVVGFYLINAGFVSLFLKYGQKPVNSVEGFEYVATKVGVVLLVLGGMHFFNVFNIAKMRGKSLRRRGEREARESRVAIAATC